MDTMDAQKANEEPYLGRCTRMCGTLECINYGCVTERLQGRLAETLFRQVTVGNSAIDSHEKFHDESEQTPLTT